MPEYWVYENWTVKRARLHLTHCPHCNGGKGKNALDSGKNGQWLGPYSDKQKASQVLQGTRVADRAMCAFCAP